MINLQNFQVNQTGETCSRMLTDPVKSADMDQYLWKPYSSSSKTPLLYDAQVTVDVADDVSEPYIHLFSLCFVVYNVFF